MDNINNTAMYTAIHDIIRHIKKYEGPPLSVSI